MAAGWVSEWSLDRFLRHGHRIDGFLRHGHWVGFRGMAAWWVTGLVSEAWPLGRFQRHCCWVGHWMSF